jgi:hypothetical protein
LPTGSTAARNWERWEEAHARDPVVIVDPRAWIRQIPPSDPPPPASCRHHHRGRKRRGEGEEGSRPEGGEEEGGADGDWRSSRRGGREAEDGV